MIHIFNRRELITVLSGEKAFCIQSALNAEGIEYRTKVGTVPFFSTGRYRGTPFINQAAAQPWVIYVKASDYDRAQAAIQSALR